MAARNSNGFLLLVLRSKTFHTYYLLLITYYLFNYARRFNAMLTQALLLMLYGLTGVFASLGILYAVIRIMAKVFPNKK